MAQASESLVSSGDGDFIPVDSSSLTEIDDDEEPASAKKVSKVKGKEKVKHATCEAINKERTVMLPSCGSSNGNEMVPETGKRKGDVNVSKGYVPFP